MTKARLDGLLLFLLGCVMFLGLGFTLEHTSTVSMADFGGAYYSARCLLQNLDPYDKSDLLHVYQTESGDYTPNTVALRTVVVLNEHLPTAFILTAPFGMLAWDSACLLWMTLTAASFILAAYLMWSLTADRAPLASGLLMCVFLFNSDLLLEIGNPAGIAVSFCVIAVWCFVKERFIPAGILCLAVSLAVTPHDSGLVWLYFLLAGRKFRKRALQTLVVTVILGLPAVLWVIRVAPHWSTELLTNLRMASMHGAPSDPGPAGVHAQFPGALIIDLQSAFSLIRDNPRFYNLATYFVCAPLLFIWAVAIFRRQSSQESAWLGLAAIAPLSMLPLYHRTHDTRLLLLTFPAFAMLWAQGGLTKRFAFAFTGVGAVFTGVLPARLLAVYSIHLRESTPGLPGQLLAVVFTRPVPLILLIMGIFYLWIYVRYLPVPCASTPLGGSARESSAPTLRNSMGPAAEIIDRDTCRE
ncbi:MAG TPA: glycosyltransferase family 87 protein [Terracidiphilus sp.]|nr:glycosyltransferase family 87 protein [Terracidiphilus sp.]